MAGRKKTTARRKTKTKTKAKAKKRATTRRTTSKDNLVVGSKVKAFIRSQNCLTSGDFLTALNEQVYELVKEATERAQDNRRSTVKTYDL